MQHAQQTRQSQEAIQYTERRRSQSQQPAAKVKGYDPGNTPSAPCSRQQPDSSAQANPPSDAHRRDDGTENGTDDWTDDDSSFDSE